MNEFDFSQQVVFDIISEQVATMVINGVAQNSQEMRSVVIKCPSCDDVIIKFNSGIPLVEIYKRFGLEGTPENFPKFCPHCGAKIMCDKTIVSTQVGEYSND